MKKRLLIIIIILLLFTAGLFAGNKPVSLKTSVPANEEMNVAIDTAIVLGFSSNVVNMSVAENNAECFKLQDFFERAVEIDVYLPDDQMEPENKRTITITPVEPLYPNMKYILTISAGLLAKNGNSLGEDQIISFITAE